MYYPILTTVTSVKTSDIVTDKTTADDIFKKYILRAGKVFSSLAGTEIAPYKATKYYNHPYPYTNKLHLGDNLLELISIYTEGGDREISTSDVILLCGMDTNSTPYDTIEIKTTSLSPFFEAGDATQNSNIVTGVWGWHDDLSTMWMNSQDTVLSSTSNTIVVNDADGLNLNFETRFEVFQLCKVVQGTSFEYFIINSISSNTLNVIRGVNGTTALTLTGGEVIYTFVPPYEIEQAIRRLVAWYYRQKDSSRADLDRPVITNVGVVMPSHLPKDVVEMATSLRNPLRG